MFRRCYDYMFDELEINNYSRWLAANNPARYGMPDLGRVPRPCRSDFYSLDYPRQLYWMPQNWIYPSLDTSCFSRRSERRFHHPKGLHFTREKRNFADDRCFEHRLEKEDGTAKFGRSKRETFPPRFHSRMEPNWDKDSTALHCHSELHEDRNPSRLSHRSSYIDLCADDFFPSQSRNCRQGFGDSHQSSELVPLDGRDFKEHKNIPGNFATRDSSANFSNKNLSDSNWRQHVLKTSSSHLLDCSGRDSPKDFSRNYESWYCPQEQQQIIDTLKEVNLRHDRQLRRDMIGHRSDRQCSDESASSHVESSSLDCLQRSSESSEDDEDNINIILSPGGTILELEETNEEEELKPIYLEKSASDFFEEFQNIFTVSPEKQIFNDLTKETLNGPTNGSEDGKLKARRISIDDKDAVRNSLKFEDLEDETETTDSTSSTKPSSPEIAGVQPHESAVDSHSEAVENTCGSDTKDMDPSAESMPKICEKEMSTDAGVPSAKNMVRVNDLRNAEGEYIEDKTGCDISAHKNRKAEPLPKTSGKQQTIHELNHGLQSRSWKYTASTSQFNEKLLKASSNSFSMSKSHNQPSASAPELKSYRQRDHQQSPESANTMEVCSRNKPPEATYNSKVCFSESCLDSRKAGNVYRRISVSEIFDSVNAESETNKQILKQRQDYVNKMIQEPNARTSMSPSAHLKLILGIGVENSKEVKRKDSHLSPLAECSAISPFTDSKKVIGDLIDSVNKSASAKIPFKHAQHSYCTNPTDKVKTGKLELSSASHPRNPAATNKVYSQTLNEEHKPNLFKASERKVFDRNDQMYRKDFNSSSLKATLKSVGTDTTVSTPNTASSKCETVSLHHKNFYHEEVSNCKSANTKQSVNKGKNQKGDHVSERESLKSNKKYQNKKDPDEMSSKDIVQKRLPFENGAESAGNHEKFIENRQLSSKPKRTFVCKKVQKFSRKSTYEREGYCKEDGKDNQGYQTDSFKNRNQERRNKSYERSASLDAGGPEPREIQSDCAKASETRQENQLSSVQSKISTKPYEFKMKGRSYERTHFVEACYSGGKELEDESKNASTRKSDARVKFSKDSYSTIESVKNESSDFEDKVKKGEKTKDSAKNGHQKRNFLKDLNGKNPNTPDDSEKEVIEGVNGTGVIKPPNNSSDQASEKTICSKKVKEKSTIDKFQTRNSYSVENSRFISVSIEQQIVRKMVKELEKTGCLVKKLKIDFKRYRNRKDRLTLKYCMARSGSFPSPRNHLFMDHVLNQKLTVSVHKLFLSDAVLPVLIVSTDEIGKDGKCHQVVILEESAVRSLSTADLRQLKRNDCTGKYHDLASEAFSTLRRNLDSFAGFGNCLNLHDVKIDDM